ncbi:phosphonate C-P lyase system protein PhnG [Gordonia sp. HY442]|uniref:phosphonate C-P lyase system protein PhnG n=1 Tax=Gordonia zhenghanii TaxID=2911516 RepID=UPI001F030B05|nr:phosphonate C-P lyase system protein PhnG [Gordonia zhenghanii]MCF8607219.1 phosphonate C-P lyase system protein PhnG [Gordonia zhenghanii]
MSVTTDPTTVGSEVKAERQEWMRVLASADSVAVEDAWEQWQPKPHTQNIRGPEVGLVMIRARTDSAGPRFNLGEATVTRATVRLHGEPMSEDTVGTAYVLGTDLAHSQAAAQFDALLADPVHHDRVIAEVIEPLQEAQTERDQVRRARERSTQVDFFTVAREHE